MRSRRVYPKGSYCNHRLQTYSAKIKIEAQIKEPVEIEISQDARERAETLLEKSPEYDRYSEGQLTLPVIERPNVDAKNQITSRCRSSDGSWLLKAWEEIDQSVKVSANDHEE